MLATLAPPTPSQPRLRSVQERFPPSRIVGDMTDDEYLRFLEGAQEKHIYVEGKVIRVAGVSFEHNMLAMDTAVELSIACQAAINGCEVLGSDQRVYIGRRVHYFPDAVVVCGDAQVDAKDALRNPAIIIEVLSHSTQEDDRTDKFTDYQKISRLRHYVLVDQYQVAVTHYEKQSDESRTVVGQHLSLDGQLTFNDIEVSIPLSRMYRRVRFNAAA